jgi:hypothetical protein
VTERILLIEDDIRLAEMVSDHMGMTLLQQNQAFTKGRGLHLFERCSRQSAHNQPQSRSARATSTRALSLLQGYSIKETAEILSFSTGWVRIRIKRYIEGGPVLLGDQRAQNGTEPTILRPTRLLDQVVSDRCVALTQQQETIRPSTLFHWWPKAPAPRWK